MNFSPKCKQWYILLHYGRWWIFPVSKNIALQYLPQFSITVCAAQKYTMDVQFIFKSSLYCVGGLKKNAMAVGFSHNFDTAYTLNGLQLGLFGLLTQRQRSGLPCMHNEKLKSCFALRRCQVFPHPIRNAQALAKQIMII